MLENAKRWVNPINTSNKAKKIRRSMMAGLATFAVAILLFAQIVLSADEAKMPAQESLYARSAALIDGDTGRLLYGKEEDVILPMASTTKIMTCILVLEMLCIFLLAMLPHSRRCILACKKAGHFAARISYIH